MPSLQARSSSMPRQRICSIIHLGGRFFKTHFKKICFLMKPNENGADIFNSVRITQQLQDVCTLLSLETEFIDWRRFLLAAAQPWPPASKLDLLLTLERCREVDTTLSGRLTRDEFDQVCFSAFNTSKVKSLKYIYCETYSMK